MGKFMMVNNFKSVSAFSPLLVSTKHFTDVHIKTAKTLTMHLTFSKASSQTSYVDIMTQKGNDGEVGNLSTRATEYILCVEKTGLESFYQFCPQGFLKVADGSTGSVRDICTVFVWLSIDHQLTDANRYQLTNFIN